MSYSKTILVGRAGKDAELFEGKDFEICKFSLATSESFKDREGNWKEVVEWHNIVYSRKGAKAYSNRIKKGDLVLVEGKNKTRSYENKDGETIYVREVKADLLRHFKLERKEKGEMKAAEKTQSVKQKELPDDDLPF